MSDSESEGWGCCFSDPGDEERPNGLTVASEPEDEIGGGWDDVWPDLLGEAAGPAPANATGHRNPLLAWAARRRRRVPLSWHLRHAT